MKLTGTSVLLKNAPKR